MRFWIDIANSPHAPFFAPVSESLEERGHEVVVTAWDRAQTLDLAGSFWPDLIKVGSGASSSVFGKGKRLVDRIRALRTAVKGRSIDVALSHGSYAQIVAARSLRKRVITMMDYEHQPANHLSFRLANVVMVPESFPEAAVRKFGGRGKTVRYKGYKENVSLARFVPGPGLREALEIGEDRILAVARTPPEGALYHRGSNDLFETAIDHLTRADVHVVLSPRDSAQANKYRSMPGVTVLDRAVDGPTLIHDADLVIGGGGTMTREAAVMGTPTYTLFSGQPPAVDEALIAEGRLQRISSENDLSSIRIAKKVDRRWSPDHSTLRQIVELIEQSARRGA